MLKNYRERNLKLDGGVRANLITVVYEHSLLFMSNHRCAVALLLVADVIDRFCCRCLLTTQNPVSTCSAFYHSCGVVICTLFFFHQVYLRWKWEACPFFIEKYREPEARKCRGEEEEVNQDFWSLTPNHYSHFCIVVFAVGCSLCLI